MSGLKVGEKVKFKLDEPIMLVSTVYDGAFISGPMVECCYFDTIGIYHKCNIPEACLDKVVS